MATDPPPSLTRATSGSGRFPLGKDSSRKQGRGDCAGNGCDSDAAAAKMGDLLIMYLAHEGDLEGIRSILDKGADPNFADEDGRTALHVAACEGFVDVVKLLLERGAHPEPEDQWGSTPLADAIHYKKQEVVDLLEQHGAKVKVAPMHVNDAREVPEYEIDRSELDFTGSINLNKGTFRLATWRGIKVAVKQLNDSLIDDEEKVRTFRDELALLQLVRHPNVVQFLGAVTQSSPMMIITEYLPKGDLRAYLDNSKALNPSLAVKFALDIARGMNCLHERKSETIIHRDLEPSNILVDDTEHLKVADFGISKLLKVRKAETREDNSVSRDYSCRYVAPEIYRNQVFDVKVDVFSFALILQEMIEGHPPFPEKKIVDDVLMAYASNERPPFRASSKCYAHGLKDLIQGCWSDDPARRPPFRDIIKRLTVIQRKIAHDKEFEVTRCLQLFGFWRKERSSSGGSSRSSISNP